MRVCCTFRAGDCIRMPTLVLGSDNKNSAGFSPERQCGSGTGRMKEFPLFIAHYVEKRPDNRRTGSYVTKALSRSASSYIEAYNNSTS